MSQNSKSRSEQCFVASTSDITDRAFSLQDMDLARDHANRMIVNDHLAEQETYTVEFRLVRDGIVLEEKTSQTPIAAHAKGQTIHLVDAATGKSRILTVALCTIGKMNRANTNPLRQVVFLRES